MGVDLRIFRLEVAKQFANELAAHAEREDELLYKFGESHLGETERKSLFAFLRLPQKGHDD